MKDEITDYIEEIAFETTYIGDTRSYQSKELLLPLKRTFDQDMLFGDQSPGIFVYIKEHEGRGIDLLTKTRAYRDLSYICNFFSIRLAQTLDQNSILSFQLKKEKEQIEKTKETCSDISKQYNQLARTSETEKRILAHKTDETIQTENAKRTA